MDKHEAIVRALKASDDNPERMTVLDFGILLYTMGYESGMGRQTTSKTYPAVVLSAIAFMQENVSVYDLDVDVLCAMIGSTGQKTTDNDTDAFLRRLSSEWTQEK